MLFIILHASTVFSYLYHMVLLFSRGAYARWTYSNYNLNTGILGTILVYGKDILIVLLFLYLCYVNIKALKIGIAFAIFVMYGTLILILNGYTLMYVIPGIRCFLYFAVMCMHFFYMQDYPDKLEQKVTFQKINKWFYVILGIELFFVWLQLDFIEFQNIGQGTSHRLPGTFGNAANLGYWLIGMAMFMAASRIKYKKKFIIGYILFVSVFLLVLLATGSRSSMFCVFIIGLAYVIQMIQERYKIKLKQLIIFSVIIISLAVYPLIKVLENLVGRGSIFVSGGGRVGAFLKVLEVDNILQLLFGRGIGFTTNSSVSLGLEATFIVDGGFTTILAQCGLLGIVVLLIYFCKVLKFMFHDRKQYTVLNLTFLGVIIINMVTINYFEQWAFVVVSVYAFELLWITNNEMNIVM